jgi:hypothetical protein
MRGSVPPPEESPDEITTDIEPLVRLRRDVRKAAEGLTSGQARFLVDTYYQIQQFRIEAAGQQRAATVAQEPIEFVKWVTGVMTIFEGSIKSALESYANAQIPGRWAMSIVGIGPVIAAGLLAHIDIRKARTAGAIWRFAGLDPSNEWMSAEQARTLVGEMWTGDPDADVVTIATRLKRRLDSFQRLAADRKTGKITKTSLEKAAARRPWNARLKVLAWKIGESFVKQQAHASDFYGKLYVQRKAQEALRNEEGRFADQAAAILKRKRIGKDTIAYSWYIQGKLPPAQIHARAKRWAVKLFLAHYQHVAFEATMGTPPPKPYVLTHVPGHQDHILPPNWPMPS